MTLTLKSFLGVLILSFFFSLSSAQIISTIAGNGTPGNSGDGGQALSASVYGNDIAADGAGNVYFVTDLTIRKVSSTGVITTLAGNGTSGTGGDGGPAVNAQFLLLRGIGADAAGNVYICDGNRVRKISTSGIITTIAGSSVSGNTGDGGQATAALLNAPADVATDGSNNVYITDRGNNRVRKITATTGIIAAHFSMSNCGFIAVTSNGAVYYTNYFNSIDKFYNGVNYPLSTGYSSYPYGPDGVLAYANGYSTVQGLAVDEAGNIFLTANNKVRVIRPNNYIYTYAGNGTAAFGGDGGVAHMGNLSDPKGVAVHGSTLYISDRGNYRIRKVNGCSGAPATPGAISGPTTFCPGTSYTFSVPVSTDGFYYSWTLPGGWYISSSSFLNTITVTAGASSGTVSVQCINTCGASTAQTLTVANVIPQPTFTPPNTAQYTLCPGATMLLSVSTAPNISVQWKKDGISIPGATSPTYTANAIGLYSVHQTHISGCSGEAWGINISSPTAEIHSYQSFLNFCPGDSLLLFAEANTSSSISAYQWQYNGANIPNSNNDSFYAKQPGDYSVTITAGCNLIAPTINLQLADTAVVTLAPGSTIFCPETFSIELELISPVWYFEWYHNNVLVSSDETYFAPTAGIYQGVAINYAGCRSQIFVELTDHDVPVGVTLPDGDFSCDGSPLLLEAINCQNCVYQWYSNANFIPGANSASYTATATAGYAYTVNDNLCGPYTGGPYYVNIDSFEFNIAPDGPTVLCSGENVELMVPGAWTNSYQWMQNGNVIPGAINNAYLVTSSGDYSVEINNDNCSFTAVGMNVSITPPPTPTITQSGNDLSVPSGFISYQWYLNGNAISGANSETYTATQDGDYYVVVSDGCEGQSNTVNLFLSVGDMNAGGSSIVIRPNPFSDFAVLTFDNTQRLAHSFKLYNVQGQLVQDLRNITTGELKIERGVLSAGMYYFQLRNDKGVVGKGKLIIQ